MIIYTIGYGNDSPDKFLARLKNAGIDYLVDVRRKGTRAWCREYWGCNISEWIYSSDTDVIMISSGMFGNIHGLEGYKAWLGGSVGTARIKDLISDLETVYAQRPCIMCSEKQAYKDGEVNCHRVYVAEELAKLSKCEVVHL